jgi:hypothetical protein
MDFRCKTKEFQCKQQVFVKIVADPTVEETRWLPACAALDKNELLRSPQSARKKQQQKTSPVLSFGAFVSTCLNATVLSAGQVFMVAAAACTCGTLSSVLFGQSYDRVMYHCGPQDTITGILALIAIPFFWTGWFLHKHKYLKPLLLILVGAPVACFLGTVVLGLPALLIGLFSFLCLTGFLYAGSYISSFKNNWPRKFKPTLFLSIAYISAVFLLAYEFVQLDLSNVVEHVPPSSLFYSAATIAGFALLPAFLTALASGTKRFGSAVGLAVIGQMPVLTLVLIYCLANAIMAAAAGLFGTAALAEYFARTAPGTLSPDFDLAATNQSELLSKLLSSAVVGVSILLSLLAGSTLGLAFNRRRIQK